jgi:hypothetical protein
LTLGNLRHGSCFTVERFVTACARLFRRYLVLGVALMITYVVSGAVYLAFVIYGYRTLGAGGFVIEWTLIAALSAVALVLWITSVNLIYLLLQIVTAIDDLAFGQAIRAVARFIRSEFLELGGVFLVVFGMVMGATFASALAWSGVGLIAFVPLVGLAVFPLQIAALILRGLVFEYIGLTAMGAYITLYRQYVARADVTHGITASSVARSVSAG